MQVSMQVYHTCIHDKLMHYFHSRRTISSSNTGFIVSAHRLINITLLTLVQATLTVVVPWGVADLYP